MEKRSELTLTQIAVVVLALAGFLVVLAFLLLNLDLESLTDDEVCRLSVLERATVPSVAQNLVPLKCLTKKICFVTGSDEECLAFAGEDNVVSIKLSRDDERAATRIEEVSANALLDCWNNFGRGKLDVFSEGGESLPSNVLSDLFLVDKVTPSCVVCSRVALSEEVKNDRGIMPKVNFVDFMENNVVPGTKKTYLQLLTGDQVSALPGKVEAKLRSAENLQTTDHMAFVFKQVVVDGDSGLDAAYEKGITTGVTVAGGLFVSPFGKVGVVPAGIASLVAAGGAGTLAYFQAEENQAIAATHCGSFTSPNRVSQGCSFVLPFDYNNFAALKEQCSDRIIAT